MTYPRVQIVDAPSATATVRWDANQESGTSPRRLWADFSAGAPSFEGDPGSVGALYGYRTLSFTQEVRGDKAFAMATLSGLARELLRAGNWLRVQLTSTQSPVYFKLYPTQPEPVSLEQVSVDEVTGGETVLDDRWTIPVQWVADAFAYGERVTHSNVTITQSPTATNPMHVTLPAIRGDAPAPLRIKVTPNKAVNYNASVWMFGCVSGTTDMADPVLDLGTGSTAGTGTVVATAAGYFGGSYLATTVAPNDAGTGANVQTRVATTFPAVPVGRYRVMLRTEAQKPAGLAADKTYVYQLFYGVDQVGTTATVKVSPTPSPNSVSHWQGWVDLGTITLPRSIQLPPDLAKTASANSPAYFVKVGTSDNSAGVVNLDAIKLIPVDGYTVSSVESLTGVIRSPGLALTFVGFVDGDSEGYWTQDTSGAYYGPKVTLSGGFPTADPAADKNLLLLMAIAPEYGNGTIAAGSTGYITGLGATAVVQVSYLPRFLNFGDGS